MRISSFLPACLLLIAACGENVPSGGVETVVTRPEAPPAGTVVANESTQHAGDGLNQFTFRVKITKAPERGVYTVQAEDGPNKGETQFTLPKGAEDYPVVLQRESDSRMRIGFKVPGDTAFYPYYEVVSEGKTIRAQYTNAYKL